MLAHELAQSLLKVESFEALGKQEERKSAILSVINISTHMGYETGFRTVGNIADSQDNESDIVAYAVLPTGEVSYFLPRSTRSYDGYTRQDKLQRINDFIDGKYPEKEGHFN